MTFKPYVPSPSVMIKRTPRYTPRPIYTKDIPRPPKLTDALERRLVELFRQGVSVDNACAAVHIHRNTFYRWLKDGEDEENVYQHRLLLAVTEARGNHFGELETKVSRSAKEGIVTDTYRYKVTVDAETGEQQVTKYLYQTVCEDGSKLALDVLSRQNPTQWSRKSQVDVTSSDGSMFHNVNGGGSGQGLLGSGEGNGQGRVNFDALSVELLQRVVGDLEADGKLTRDTQLQVLHELAAAGEDVIDVEAREVKVAPKFVICAATADEYA